jgi:hypothetical protein
MLLVRGKEFRVEGRGKRKRENGGGVLRELGGQLALGVLKPVRLVDDDVLPHDLLEVLLVAHGELIPEAEGMLCNYVMMLCCVMLYNAV